ncbi:molybdopterin-dependent oxidoreductase [Roseomonas sp. NAR14]|uniref:Molybdopterin-dependent oxidoreductase n=1 Tax=Roseomonas acroporae TaxID=2937791 RepID=A0A9X2BX86_9PROT|nr:molybdopterin-dependent oxidoreductase [Roseomonas acroporae]MCK8784725.1 molybdopterin-dependent oxidoreductase [Roseomonas acroporae]
MRPARAMRPPFRPAARLAGALLGVLAWLAPVPSHSQQVGSQQVGSQQVGSQQVGGAAPAAPEAAAAGIAVGREGGPTRVLTPAALAALPAVSAPLPAGHGTASRTAEGPLLWSVLVEAGAVDPAAVREQVRQIVVLTGSDGYTAVLALGEIAPEFGNQPVLLALRVDGRPLDPAHLRLAVPGEKRGGRGVHDLVRITVGTPPAAAR